MQGGHTLAVLYVLGLWWLGTGVVLKMVWLDRATMRWSVGGSAVLAALGIGGLVWSARTAEPAYAYLGFASSLAVWAFHELTFLLGLVTGPRKIPCPPDARGWARFAAGTAVVIHHEVALAATLGVVVLMTWGQPNQVGTWTFLVLWAMRLSAKLNVFLGVRNLSEQFVPAHLRYMLGYFRRARMNALMPFSIVLPSIVVVQLATDALASDASAFVRVSCTLVGTILALAILEHVFLAVPLPDALLWKWAIRQKSPSLRATEVP